VVPAIDLALGHVHDVTEDAANGRPDGVQDAKRLLGSPDHRHPCSAPLHAG